MTVRSFKSGPFRQLSTMWRAVCASTAAKISSINCFEVSIIVFRFMGSYDSRGSRIDSSCQIDSTLLSSAEIQPTFSDFCGISVVKDG